MTKTIYTRIINKKITSVELKSVLGRELYICNNGNWTDVLNEFSFSWHSSASSISNCKAMGELNNVSRNYRKGRMRINEQQTISKTHLRITNSKSLGLCIPLFQQSRSRSRSLFS